MSTTPIKHHQRTRAVLASNLPPLQRLLLIAISDHLSDGNDYCWPSLPRLMNLTGLATSTIKRHLALMESTDRLYVERKEGRANRYMIDWDRLKAPSPESAGSTQPRASRVTENPAQSDPAQSRLGSGTTQPRASPPPAQSGLTPSPERAPKKVKEEGKERGSTTTPTVEVVQTRREPSPQPTAPPVAVASSDSSSPPPRHAEDRPTASIPVIGPRLVSLGIQTLGDLSLFSRDALYTLTVDSDRPFRSGELDLIATALRRANLQQASSGRPQTSVDGSPLQLVGLNPWDDRPIVPIRLKKFEWPDAVAEWASHNEHQLNLLREDIREAGGGWPELRIWLSHRVEDPDAVIAHLQQLQQVA